MFTPFWFLMAHKELTERRKLIIEYLKKKGVPISEKGIIPEKYFEEYHLLKRDLKFLDKVNREVATDFVLEHAEKFYPYWEKIKNCEWVKYYPTNDRFLIKCKEKNGRIKSLHNLKNPERLLAIYKILLIRFKNSLAEDLLKELKTILQNRGGIL